MKIYTAMLQLHFVDQISLGKKYLTFETMALHEKMQTLIK